MVVFLVIEVIDVDLLVEFWEWVEEVIVLSELFVVGNGLVIMFVVVMRLVLGGAVLLVIVVNEVFVGI